jgi:glycosyltransferase involved in cell wall biosynthesis
LKKILFITYEYPTHTPFGGIAFYYAKVVKLLARQDFEVTVVAAKVVEREIKMVEIKQSDNIKEVFITCSDSGKFHKLVINWLFQDNAKYDIIELPEYGSLFYKDVIAGSLKTFADKIVVRVHGTSLLAAIYDLPNNFRKTFFHIYKRFLLSRVILRLLKYTKSKHYKIVKANYREFRLIKNADIVTAPSYLMGYFVNSNWLKNSKTIVFPNPNQYNIGLYEKKPFDKTGFRVSYVNRLQYWKGFDLFYLLSKRFSKKSNIKFSAFGSYNQLNIGSTKDQISKTVELMGFVNTDELIDVYRKSHIIIVPSRFESFSNVALEAMGFSCIVIVSDNIGMAEHITHGLNGFVFQSDKYHSLETVFNEIIGMEITELERVSFNAYQTALKLSENKELLEFYNSI